MKTHFLALIVIGVLSASGAYDSDADVQRAKAQVAAVEPLSAAPFYRTEYLGLSEHGATRAIEVTYTIRPPLGSAELRQRIVALFTERGWTIGMPPGYPSPSATYPDGRVVYPLAFHRATPERIKGQYHIRHAHLFIADDLSTVRCTYDFRFTK